MTVRKDKDLIISVIGLGYVGMPVAVAFAEKVRVIGFDINKQKIELYRSGIDPTNEVGNKVIESTTVEFTNNINDIREANFHIIAVPTPLTDSKNPDLTPLLNASKIVSSVLEKGDIVVYESTVYPGVTQDLCIPTLEEGSGLICGVDFKVGYSPERINPGDKIHTLQNIVKVVSGSDDDALKRISEVYEMIVHAGVHRASSIKVAEAAKVIENSQRDINIAFMNELSKIFNLLEINTNDVLEAAGTKWNFLKFTPGLVGGHCIGIDPFYLTFKAEQLGYHSDLILTGRKINDDMGKHVVEYTIKKMIQEKIDMKNAKIGILGLAFKENTPDIRNSRVIDIYEELQSYGMDVLVSDPMADPDEVKSMYGFELADIESMRDLSALIVAVPHDEYRLIPKEQLDVMLSNSKILIDLKGVFRDFENDFVYWSL